MCIEIEKTIKLDDASQVSCIIETVAQVQRSSLTLQEVLKLEYYT